MRDIGERDLGSFCPSTSYIYLTNNLGILTSCMVSFHGVSIILIAVTPVFRARRRKRY